MSELKKIYDLHTHTTYSDGTFTVEEIIKRAKENKLTGVAITDHDTMEGLEEGRRYSNQYGIEFIPGIEFSCTLYGLEVHILGYFLNETEELEKKLKELKLSREERNIKVIEKLNQRGLKITMEDVLKEATGTIVSRAHICNAMMKKGYVYTKSEAFSQYLGRDKAAFVEKKSSDAIEIVKLIKKCGGIAVIAHPSLISNSYEKIEKVITDLQKYGVDGIEAEYSSYTDKERVYFRELAINKGLLITGGSDFHGDNRIGVDIGDAYLTKEELDKFFKIMRRD